MFYKKIFPLLKKRSDFPNISETVYALRTLSPVKKIIFLGAVLIFISSLLAIAWKINADFLVDVPANGGTLTEGIIGTPRFINPLLAISDADRDMSSLVYSGLTRTDNKNGLIPDLAENYAISKDGLVYTFVLRPNIFWQDGKPVTSDDILFTVKQAKDQNLKSPKRANWEGIEVEKVNERTVRFILKKPYAPFLGNTTLGILPKHIWKDASSERMALSEFNIKPVGSGPYEIENINKDSSGIITSYVLRANKKFSLGKPHINKLILKFYPSEEKLISAYANGDVDSINAVSPKLARKVLKKESRLETFSLPRVFGVFFNQNNAKIFSQTEVRKALNMATDKQEIVDKVLNGFGTVDNYPLPPGAFGSLNKNEERKFSLEKAKEILKRNGWKMEDSKNLKNEKEEKEKENILVKKTKNETLRLEFSLSTSNSPELKKTAELLKTMWQKLGAKVNLKIFEIGDLNQDIIRPRKYDALLFGEILGRNPDPFVFWHSSQRNDPGLNIAMYANVTVDKLLEDARSISDPEKRNEEYKKFQEEVAKDVPAVFLYSPQFIYIIPKSLLGVEQIKNITVPSERFAQIYKWHLSTDKVWKFFAKKGK